MKLKIKDCLIPLLFFPALAFAQNNTTAVGTEPIEVGLDLAKSVITGPGRNVHVNAVVLDNKNDTPVRVTLEILEPSSARFKRPSDLDYLTDCVIPDQQTLTCTLAPKMWEVASIKMSFAPRAKKHTMPLNVLVTTDQQEQPIRALSAAIQISGKSELRGSFATASESQEQGGLVRLRGMAEFVNSGFGRTPAVDYSFGLQTDAGVVGRFGLPTIKVPSLQPGQRFKAPYNFAVPRDLDFRILCLNAKEKDITLTYGHCTTVHGTLPWK